MESKKERNGFMAAPDFFLNLGRQQQEHADHF